jgi:hypothetical protein
VLLEGSREVWTLGSTLTLNHPLFFPFWDRVLLCNLFSPLNSWSSCLIDRFVRISFYLLLSSFLNLLLSIIVWERGGIQKSSSFCAFLCPHCTSTMFSGYNFLLKLVVSGKFLEFIPLDKRLANYAPSPTYPGPPPQQIWPATCFYNFIETQLTSFI